MKVSKIIPKVFRGRILALYHRYIKRSTKNGTNHFGGNIDSTFFPDLETERLLLRNISQEDADFVFKEYSNPLVCEYQVEHEPFQSIDEAKKWIGWYYNGIADHHRWVIINKETGRRMGTIGFHAWDKKNNRVEIGCELLPENWGKGYILEATQRAVDFAFHEMNVHRVVAHVHTENLRSARLLEKLGFEREGLIRDEFYFRGKYYDHYLYSLINSESKA